MLAPAVGMSDVLKTERLLLRELKALRIERLVDGELRQFRENDGFSAMRPAIASP